MVLLSGNRRGKLVTPSCCSLDNQQNYKHFDDLHKNVWLPDRKTHDRITAIKGRWIKNRKKKTSEKSVIFIVNPPENPKSHYTTHARLSKTNTNTHTHIRSLLARTTMESSGDVKTLFQSSTLQGRNLKVAPQYEPTALSLHTWKNQITQDRKYWTQ